MQTNKQTDFANQDDTISRQAVINLLKQMRKDGDMVPWEGKDVFARIRELPSAHPDLDSAYTEGYTQAEAKYRAMWDEMQRQPEIIRCKDCVHWFDIDNGRQIHTMCAQVDGDWFCGDAERREQ